MKVVETRIQHDKRTDRDGPGNLLLPNLTARLTNFFYVAFMRIDPHSSLLNQKFNLLKIFYF